MCAQMEEAHGEQARSPAQERSRDDEISQAIGSQRTSKKRRI